jgi:hypothetical protein
MRDRCTANTVVAALFIASQAAAAPTVYPTGTTIYDPERAWSGYFTRLDFRVRC